MGRCQCISGLCYINNMKHHLDRLAGKGILLDESLISTTDLLAEHGHKKLLEAKIKNYN